MLRVQLKLFRSMHPSAWMALPVLLKNDSCVTRSAVGTRFAGMTSFKDGLVCSHSTTVSSLGRGGSCLRCRDIAKTKANEHSRLSLSFWREKGVNQITSACSEVSQGSTRRRSAEIGAKMMKITHPMIRVIHRKGAGAGLQRCGANRPSASKPCSGCRRNRSHNPFSASVRSSVASLRQEECPKSAERTLSVRLSR